MTKAVLLAVALLASLVGPAGAAGGFEDYGRTHSLDRALRPGCHRYVYSYHVRPPTAEWQLEVQLVDPRGHKLAFDAFTSGGDPVDGKDHFTICKPSTRAGRFEIHGRLVLKSGDSTRQGNIPTSTFRLCRPRSDGKPGCARR